MTFPSHLGEHLESPECGGIAMLEALLQDKRDEHYHSPHPQKTVTLGGAAGVCGQSSPSRKEGKWRGNKNSLESSGPARPR